MQTEIQRDQTIDAFRGIAILSVLVFHYFLRWTPPLSPENLAGLTQSYPAWMEVGRLGVQLFFVVSGLVITMTILRSHDVVDFAVKRLARLYPPFLFAATATTLIFVFGDPLGFKVSARDFLINLTMLPIPLGAKPVDGAYWSLAPELFFYGWTAICWIIFKKRFWIGLIVVAVCGFLISFASPKIGSLMLSEYSAFFLAGVSLWFLMNKDRSGLILLAVAVALYVAGAFRPEEAGPSHLIRHSFLIVSIGALFALLLKRPGMKWGPLAWIGRISYSLYLIHQNLGVTGIRLLKDMGASDFVAVTIVSISAIIAAWLMFKFIELPGQRLVLKAYRMARTSSLQAVNL
ncbi:acyltransferase family protein [Caulobacter sp. ErkDOM-E]|uniref:acyltransferase family protein n=1 Tax=Caulobacter sp. ErkDOM-E TaxID=3402778 RepID=UPI003AF67E25